MPEEGPSPKRRPTDLVLPIGVLAILGMALWWGMRLPLLLEAPGYDVVQVMEEVVRPEPPPPEPEPLPEHEPPPPPPPEPEPEPPPEPVADPDDIAPEEPPVEPVEAVFGVQEEALSESGNMAVATGNTLMKKADSVVREVPPPLPPGPVHLDREPRIVRGVAPEYPARAIDWGMEGTVVALIRIDTTGKVVEVEIVQSAGRDFDHNVRKAALATVFEPPIRNGRRVPSTFRRNYEFRLE